MKVQLVLQKTYDIDLDAPANKDIKEMIIEKVEEMDGDPKDPDSIHDAIRLCLEDDISSVVDLDIDENDFQIEVK